MPGKNIFQNIPAEEPEVMNRILAGKMILCYICTLLTRSDPARMAELVDALVSNTSGRKAVPVRPRLRVQKWKKQIFDLVLPFFIVQPIGIPESLLPSRAK